jgi:hypothetical protein
MNGKKNLLNFLREKKYVPSVKVRDVHIGVVSLKLNIIWNVLGATGKER